MAVIGLIAQGMMGAGVGRRLHESGAEVRTLLSGRSPASAERAKGAGMVAAADERELLAGADFFLSILPPAAAGEEGPVDLCLGRACPRGSAAARLGDRFARRRRTDRRRLRSENVLRR